MIYYTFWSSDFTEQTNILGRYVFKTFEELHNHLDIHLNRYNMSRNVFIYKIDSESIGIDADNIVFTSESFTIINKKHYDEYLVMILLSLL